MEKQLGMNTDGILNAQLPLGPEYDDYKMVLVAKIIDTLGGAAVYNICNIRVREKVFLDHKFLFPLLYFTHMQENTDSG